MNSRGLLPGAFVFLLLAACATTPHQGTTLDPAAQRAVIAGLDHYQVEGRVAVAAGAEGFNASMSWRQSGPASSVRLAGPMGAGSLQLQFGQGHLHIESSRGRKLEDADAQALIDEQLGFTPPLEALRYWLSGLAAPGESQESRSPDGQLLSLTQQGWLVEYQEFQPQHAAEGTVPLPAKLRASRENLRLRVVIDSWLLEP